MAAKKTKPMSDPQNKLGRAYADALKLRAIALRSTFLVDQKTRDSIADDLDVLAELAERHPEVFGLLQRRVGG